MLYLFIYLSGIVDTFRNYLGGSLFFIIIVTLALIIFRFVIKVVPEEFEESFIEQVPKFAKHATIVCCIVSLLYICVPPKEVIYQMAGVYYGKQINQQVHIDSKLQKFLKSLIYS